MNTHLLDLDRLLAEAKKLPPAVTPDYRWRVLELFCDGYLAHQQSALGIHYQALVSTTYRPQQIVIAFDGMPVFALNGNQVALDRLVQPIDHYQSKPL